MHLTILLATALTVVSAQQTTLSLPNNWPTQVIPRFTPSALLTVIYPNITINATNSGVLVPTLEDVANLPRFQLSPPLNGSFLVFMIDPDAPTPQSPTAGQILHYLRANATCNSTTGFLSSRDDPIATYIGSGPPAGSDPHRYIFAVYQQPDGYEFPEGFNGTNRRNFNLTELAEESGLDAPVAGQFFTAQRGNVTDDDDDNDDNGDDETDDEDNGNGGVGGGNGNGNGTGDGVAPPPQGSAAVKMQIAGWAVTAIAGLGMLSQIL